LVGPQRLANLFMQLRKICCHPYIFQIGREFNDIPNFKNNEHVPEIISYSGKMIMLERLLLELFSRGHKVIIFSQFVTYIFSNYI
jgi:ATP-dependent DNA helicase